MSAKQAPSDAACVKAWERIMEIASSHALILQAYGGTAILALPTEQRSRGIRQRVLFAHEMRETGPVAQEVLDLGAV